MKQTRDARKRLVEAFCATIQVCRLWRSVFAKRQQKKCMPHSCSHHTRHSTGTGKTASMLALCLKTKGLIPSPPPPTMSAFGSPLTLRENKTRRAMMAENARMESLPCVSCTLIIVPLHLVQQWLQMLIKHAPALTYSVVSRQDEFPNLVQRQNWRDVIIMPTSFVRLAGFIYMLSACPLLTR